MLRKIKLRLAIWRILIDNKKLLELGSDYDVDGVPYWERTGTIDPDYRQPWKFVDPWTGDAFRLVIK